MKETFHFALTLLLHFASIVWMINMFIHTNLSVICKLPCSALIHGKLHWTEVRSGHFSSSLFWLSANDIPKYVHYNGLQLSGASEEFSIRSLFLGSKMQKSAFWRNLALSAVCLSNWSERWLRTCLADLQKHQTFEILLMTDFLWFFFKKS